ncbi:septum site-determining protein Ssd [Kineococcus sp. SYSU DK003]|uniref:septum site-determining protein Ssd n=1 Tax=Kineococcus sp. SYSU DK003 TaxID=3383124 RepID=UPI003D7C56D2
MPVRHQTRPRRPRRLIPLAPTTSGSGPAGANAPGTVLLLTDDEELAAAVARLAAAAGCVLQRGCAPGQEPRHRLVLAGVDAGTEEVQAVRGAAVTVVVVGCAPTPADWWQQAAALDPDHAVLLPEAQDWLLERLSDVADGSGAPGHGPVLAVVGGTGGAGASVLACGIARAMADTTGGCLLVDADPRSGGLDLLVGGDALPGLRWADLAGVEGRLSPQVLRSSVALGGGLHVLATDRRGGHGPAPDQLWTVLDAARRTFPATVLDLPRGSLRDLGPVLGACDEVLVVTPGTTRGAAAACVVVDEVRAVSPADVRLVVRDVGAGPDPEDVALAAGAPLAGLVRPDRDLDVTLELGEGVPGGRRSSLRVFAMACARDWAVPS